MLKHVTCAGLIGAALSSAPAFAESCRQALLLGLDVSLSVDQADFNLQRAGLAGALLAPDVMHAMAKGPGGHIEVAVFEWSGENHQRLLIDWTPVDGPERLAAMAQILLDTPQDTRSGKTALGAAMLYARDMLSRRAHCRTLTFDISGDGVNNEGIAPEHVRAALEVEGVIINGLAIDPEPFDPASRGVPEPDLQRYFQSNVIAGLGAFVEPVLGFEQYEEAMRRKLLRELVVLIADNSNTYSPRD